MKMRRFYSLTITALAVVGLIACSDSLNDNGGDKGLVVCYYGPLYHIDALLGFDETVETYSLEKFIADDDLMDQWGNYVEFLENRTFVSYSTSFCGTDCFYRVFGQYAQEDYNFTVTIDSIVVYGFCSNWKDEYGSRTLYCSDNVQRYYVDMSMDGASISLTQKGRTDGVRFLDPMLTDRRWTLSYCAKSDHSDAKYYPATNKAYLMEFASDGTIAFPYHCNIKQASYRIDAGGNIAFSGFEPMTERYCDELSDWEYAVSNILQKATTYAVSDDNLIIQTADAVAVFIPDAQ